MTVEYIRNHLNEKLLDSRTIDLEILFDEFNARYFNNNFSSPNKPKITWSKTLRAVTFHVDIEKNYIAISREILELKTYHDLGNVMLHAMVHLEVKEPIMLHGEKFEKWREQLLIDDWEIGESHKHAEAENLKRHVWKCKKCEYEFKRFTDNKHFLQRFMGLHLYPAQKEHNQELEDHLKLCGTELYVEKISVPAATSKPKARNNVVDYSQQSIEQTFSPEKQKNSPKTKHKERQCPYCLLHFKTLTQLQFNIHWRSCEIESNKREAERLKNSKKRKGAKQKNQEIPKKVRKLFLNKHKKVQDNGKDKHVIIEIDDSPIEIDSDTEFILPDMMMVGDSVVISSQEEESRPQVDIKMTLERPQYKISKKILQATNISSLKENIPKHHNRQ